MVAVVSLLRSFSENVEEGKTSYQMLGVLSFAIRRGCKTSFTKGNSANLSSEKW